MQISNSFIDQNCVPDNLFQKGIKPFDYQYDGVKTLFGKTRFLLRDDPGLGKTIQLVCAVNLIQTKTDKPLKVLVIGTKSIVINWQREAKAWSNGSAEYTIINHDKMIGKDHEKLLRNWDIVIADESHFYLKNINTQRAKMFLQIIDTAGRVWLSTATPASKSAEDYYGTLRVLLPDLFGKWTKTKFIQRYCKRVVDPWCASGFKYIGFNEKMIPELNKVLKACSLGRKQEEVKKDLPPLTFSDYFADVNFNDVKSFTAAEAKEIVRKILAGEVLGDNYQADMKKNALLKIPSVLELLNTYPAEKKVVVFAWNKTVVTNLTEEVKKNTDRTVDFINGDTSEKNRQAIIDRFQDPKGGLNTLVLNMQSGGVGINLTAATAGIYLQYPYTASFWKQSLKRIHRIGSKEPVQIIKVMIEKSIDEEIFKILQDRIDNIDQVEQ